MSKTFCGIWYCNKHTVYTLYQSFLGATNGEKVVGTIVYFIIYSIHNSTGPMEPGGQGGICPPEMGRSVPPFQPGQGGAGEDYTPPPQIFRLSAGSIARPKRVGIDQISTQ